MKETIEIHGRQFRRFIDRERIAQRIEILAKEINSDFEGQQPVFIAVLNGSFMVAGEVLKNISLDCEISFVKLKSYVGTSSQGPAKELLGLDTSLQDKPVIVLEDIVDTGNTLTQLLPNIYELGAKSVTVLTLLLKPEALEHELDIRYTGFTIPSKFVIGYGLDYDGLGRNYPELYQLAD